LRRRNFPEVPGPPILIILAPPDASQPTSNHFGNRLWLDRIVLYCLEVSYGQPGNKKRVWKEPVAGQVDPKQFGKGPEKSGKVLNSLEMPRGCSIPFLTDGKRFGKSQVLSKPRGNVLKEDAYAIKRIFHITPGLSRGKQIARKPQPC
jgi:hypothetical protein